MHNTLHVSKKPYLQHHMNGASLTCHFDNFRTGTSGTAEKHHWKRKQVSTVEKLDQTQWDESDSEPLAKVFQPMNDDGDLSYQPSSGTSSSDDNSPDHNERKTRRLRHSKTIRNAKSASVHQALLLEKERLTHAARLDNLLLANGLRRVDVPADGNCFFEACATTLQHLQCRWHKKMSLLLFRGELCPVCRVSIYFRPRWPKWKVSAVFPKCRRTATAREME